MEKKGKITKCSFTKEWGEGQSKTFFHDIELDNGDKGSIGAKEKNPDKLKIGAELTYTIEAGQYGNKIKAVVAPGGGGYSAGARKGPDPKVQLVGFAMSYTKDLIIGGKLEMRDLAASFEKIHKLMSDKL